MLSKLLFGLLILLISPCWVNAQQTNLKPLGKKGKLIWKDEFNGDGLPDSSKWGYEEGFVRNNEKQFYTKARIENCYEKNGNLVIESKKEKFNGADYTSASINTLGKYSFSGDIRVEVKAKIPDGKGIWPAIWMMGLTFGMWAGHDAVR